MSAWEVRRPDRTACRDLHIRRAGIAADRDRGLWQPAEPRNLAPERVREHGFVGLSPSSVVRPFASARSKARHRCRQRPGKRAASLEEGEFCWSIHAMSPLRAACSCPLGRAGSSRLGYQPCERQVEGEAEANSSVRSRRSTGRHGANRGTTTYSAAGRRRADQSTRRVPCAQTRRISRGQGNVPA